MKQVTILLIATITITNQIYLPPAKTVHIHENYSKVSHQSQKLNPPKTKRNSIPIYNECPSNSTGQFVYESSCNQFLNCWKGRGFVQNCPAGTLFNPQTLECDFPHKVTCITGPRIDIFERSTNRKIPQAECPSNFHGLIPNYNDCTQFYECQQGTKHPVPCPEGTYFDTKRNLCDFRERSECFQETKREIKAEVKCPSGTVGLISHPFDCSKFLQCANGQTFIQACAPGTLFNPNLQICDFPYNVQCGTVIQEPTKPNSYELVFGSTFPVVRPTATSHRNSYEPFFGSTTVRSHWEVNPPPTTQYSYTRRNSYEPFFGTTSTTVRNNWRVTPPYISQPPITQYSYEPTRSNSYGTTSTTVRNNWRVTPPYIPQPPPTQYSYEPTRSNSYGTASTTVRTHWKGPPPYIPPFSNIKEPKTAEFVLLKNNKLAVPEQQKIANITATDCGVFCVKAKDFYCRSFNYRKLDSCCFLTESNVGTGGTLIAYEIFDYYERSMGQIDCTDKFQCSNGKCIEKSEICDGKNDCDNDEANCNAIKCAEDYWACDRGNECLPLAFVCDGLLDCSDGSDEAAQHCEAPIQIRLSNGSSPNEGRLEVRHHGVWGTVCDDDFNDDAAKIVCRDLGYHSRSAIVKKDAYFGEGSGPIWLDQVFCSGNESHITNCSHWNWGEHNCEHSEDVGVICGDFVQVERHSKNEHIIDYPEETCGFRQNQFSVKDDIHFRVVQSSVAGKGEYPWQAALRVKSKHSKPHHWCGAVVISSRFVLTAAHCLVGYAKGVYVVVAGDYNVDEVENTEQEARIEDFYLHENFRKGHKMNNDIALIKLKGRGFTLNEAVQAICLPDIDDEYEDQHNCTISGFGSIESGTSMFSHNLRAGWIPILKDDVCKMPHVYGEVLTDGMFCAGSLDGGVDACDGDSGGPLACLNRGLFTLYGITSWGHRCGYANKPGVYVKVSYYKKWIREMMDKHQ